MAKDDKVPRSAAYSKAREESEALAKKLAAEGKKTFTDDEQLDLYGYGKVADKADFATAPKPGMFDIKRKAMHRRWKDVAATGISPQDAEKKYLQMAEDLKNKYSPVD